VLKRLQSVLRWVFLRVEGLFNLAFGEKLNPLYYIGPISYYLMWVIVASGLYLYAFFETSVTGAHASVEALTHGQPWAGGVLRSVLIPLLAPSMLYAWIWIALLTYRELTLPVVLSSHDNLPFSILVWSYVQSSSYGRASAAALMMLALMLPFLFLYWTVARRVGILAPRATGE